MKIYQPHKMYQRTYGNGIGSFLKSSNGKAIKAGLSQLVKLAAPGVKKYGRHIYDIAKPLVLQTGKEIGNNLMANKDQYIKLGTDYAATQASDYVNNLLAGKQPSVEQSVATIKSDIKKGGKKVLMDTIKAIENPVKGQVKNLPSVPAIQNILSAYPQVAAATDNVVNKFQGINASSFLQGEGSRKGKGLKRHGDGLMPHGSGLTQHGRGKFGVKTGQGMTRFGSGIVRL